MNLLIKRKKKATFPPGAYFITARKTLGLVKKTIVWGKMKLNFWYPGVTYVYSLKNARKAYPNIYKEGEIDYPHTAGQKFACL